MPLGSKYSVAITMYLFHLIIYSNLSAQCIQGIVQAPPNHLKLYGDYIFAANPDQNAVNMYHWNGDNLVTRTGIRNNSFTDFGQIVDADESFVAIKSDASIHIYEWSSAFSWILSKTIDHRADSMAMSNGVIVAGRRITGSAHVFRFSGTDWLEETVLLPVDYVSGRFGSNVDIDGDTIVVTDSSRRDNYIYRYINNTWTFEAKLNVSTFGTGVDNPVSLDGDYLVIGNEADSEIASGAGAAYVFKRIGNIWSQQAKLLGSNTTRSSWFGKSVSISGDYIVVGASRGGNRINVLGSVYLFHKTDNEWVELNEFGPPDEMVRISQIGVQVLIDGNAIAFSALTGAIRAAYRYNIPAVDCNFNNLPDDCPDDCNTNGIPDICDIFKGIETDCNHNGIPDFCDIRDETSQDCNANGIPGECEQDCNINGVEDICDLENGTESDCNVNLISDSCDIPRFRMRSPFLTPLGYFFRHSWTIASPPSPVNDIKFTFSTIADFRATGNYINFYVNNIFITKVFQNEFDFCPLKPIVEEYIMPLAEYQLNVGDDDINITMVSVAIRDNCDEPSYIQVAIEYERESFSSDCNVNYIPDVCDLNSGFSIDCNLNEVPDLCDVQFAGSEDCNENDIPDECDILAGLIKDCNFNQVSDDCESFTDCNMNNVQDICDIYSGISRDFNNNGFPEECEISDGCLIDKWFASELMVDDVYGRSVSISGQYAIVGTPADDEVGTDAGTAYIFQQQYGRWHEMAKLTPSAFFSGELFGSSVDIAGTVAAVTTRDDAYIYNLVGTNWIEKARFDRVARFGSPIATDGNRVVLGVSDHSHNEAGMVFIYHQVDEGWLLEKLLEPKNAASRARLGFSVDIQDHYIIAGAPFSETGSAYIYRWNGTDWVEANQLLSSDGVLNDYFGYSVSLDRDYAVVGAWRDDDRGEDSGSAYVFHRDGADWIQVAKLIGSDVGPGDRFGYSVSISGIFITVGAPNNGGEAYLFKRIDDSWVEQEKYASLSPDPLDSFGWSVSSDEQHALIGAPFTDAAPNPGSAYLYTLSGLNCTGLGLLDECKIAMGDSLDCNFNEIPAECDPVDLISYDNYDIYSDFSGCLIGPCDPAPCHPLLFEGTCCLTSDLDGDGDVDLRDYAIFQNGRAF